MCIFTFPTLKEFLTFKENVAKSMNLPTFKFLKHVLNDTYSTLLSTQSVDG